MSYKWHTKLAGLTFAAILAAAFLAPAAQATPIGPIEFFNSLANTSGTPRFTIGCGSTSGSCAGMLEALSDTSSPPGWSSTFGLMLAGPSNANPTSEMTFVNGLLGTSFTSNSGQLGPSNSFTTDAAYFLVKVGGGPTHQAYALLQNISGSSVDVWFDATGQAGGLSHYISFGPGSTSGPPAAVPEPGILGVFGLGLLLVGVGYGMRRRWSA